MYRLFLIIAVAGFAFAVKGQESKIALKTMVVGDSVMLRWAPTDYATWQLANKNGYKVERILVSKKGVVVDGNQIIQLNTSAILPYKEMDWEGVVRKDSVFAPVAMQALLGATFELSSSFKNQMMEAYNKVKENDLRFGFALYCADRSLVVAQALGLYMVDKSIKRDERYIYRVLINSESNITLSDTAYAVVSAGMVSNLVVPLKPNAMVRGKGILLAWKSTGTDYVGYNVERSFDGKRYKTITQDLVIPFEDKGKMAAFWMDSITTNTNQYYYRIVGVTPFGNSGPYSDTLKVIASEATAPPSNVEASVEINNKIKLVWKIGKSTIPLTHFVIKRSDSADGLYLPIGKTNSAKQTEWVDNTPLASGYYKVAAVTKFGVESESLETFAQLIDDTPPIVPLGLHGVVDTLGVVTLNWTPNTDKDFMGYRVFRANDVNGEYTQINDSVFPNPTFSDTITLITLTKTVAYKLAAVDQRYNSSGFSLPYVLRRPDVIKPAPPVLNSLENNENGVVLKWIESPSDDVKNIIIYRCSSNDTIVIATVNPAKNEYCDTTALRPQEYGYILTAKDSAGNESAKLPWRYIFYRNIKANDFIVLKASLLKIDTGISVLLTWNCMQDSCKIVRIYRNSGTGYILYKTLVNASQFEDLSVKQGHAYQYFIKSDVQLSNTEKISLL